MLWIAARVATFVSRQDRIMAFQSGDHVQGGRERTSDFAKPLTISGLNIGTTIVDFVGEVEFSVRHHSIREWRITNWTIVNNHAAFLMYIAQLP